MDEAQTQVQDEETVQTVPVGWHGPLRIRVFNAVAVVLSAVLALVALTTVSHIFNSETESEQASAVYQDCMDAARDLQESSDYLTSEVRVFVVTGNREYMDAYMHELLDNSRRAQAVKTLRTGLGSERKALHDLEDALKHSNTLAERELYAVRLTCEAANIADMPELVAAVRLDPADEELAPDAKRKLAEEIVLGEGYQEVKLQIREAVRSCSDELLGEQSARIQASNDELRSWLSRMRVVIVALLAIVVFVILAVIFLILWPLAAYTRQIQDGESLAVVGAAELRYLADAYNAIYEENRKRTQNLRRAAERDHLTGIYNRGAYDVLLGQNTYDMALLLVDVDFFKDVNDTYGHSTGDAVLKKVARLLQQSFRNTDLPCRIGGDEFAVIMTGVSPALRGVIRDKVGAVATALRDTSDGLPVVTLSVGIAFSEAHPDEPDISKAADRALYVVKEAGRNGMAFYDEVIEGSALPEASSEG